MHYYNMQSNFRETDPTSEQLMRALNGEYNAIICYEQLANMASSSVMKEQILKIRNDEIHHYHIISDLYQRRTGHEYTPQQTETCAQNLRQGLIKAFNDEQNTVDFYLSIADQSTEPTINNAFTRISRDEQNHAVWFLYFLTVLVNTHI